MYACIHDLGTCVAFGWARLGFPVLGTRPDGSPEETNDGGNKSQPCWPMLRLMLLQTDARGLSSDPAPLPSTRRRGCIRYGA